MLTKKQFDILVRMAEKGEPETQRSIAEGTGMSLGVVNKTLAQLTEAGFVKSGTVTPEGLDALEPYRVKRFPRDGNILRQSIDAQRRPDAF